MEQPGAVEELKSVVALLPSSDWPVPRPMVAARIIHNMMFVIAFFSIYFMRVRRESRCPRPLAKPC